MSSEPVRIEINSGGIANTRNTTVKVDGIDITRAVKHLELIMDSNAINVVKLELFAGVHIDVLAEMQEKEL